MAHQVFGRYLGRSKDTRRALFRTLVGELIAHGRVKTTIAKAKAIKPLIDKLVTKAKKASLAGRREVIGTLPKEAALRLIDTIAPQFKNRTSGFSRIVRLGQRRGDRAELVLLEWTEQVEVRSERSEVRSGKEKLEKEGKKEVRQSKEVREKKTRKRKVGKKV